MEYLKLFENHSQYEDFIQSEDFIRPNVSHCIEQEEVHYNPIIHDYSKDYLTFIALENNTSFGFEFNYHMSNFELSYSLDDGSTWNIFENQEGNIITINKGEKILWKGQVIPTRGTQNFRIGIFGSQGYFNAMGNIMSLVYSDDFVENNQLPENMVPYFQSVFEGSGIVSAENLILPATTLTIGCYRYMFMDCTNLTIAPKLPATILAEDCYGRMFENCTSLTTEAVVPDSITPVASSYCSSMYCGCSIRQISGDYPEVAYNCPTA